MSAAPKDPSPSGAPSAARAADDPVAAKRERVARIVSLAQRTGYALFGLFAVLVVVAFVTSFPAAVTTAATACLIIGSIVLAPAIVFGYGVKAADRADREHDWR